MKILNFGSLNIDNVYTVEEFVRPGETVTAKSHTVFAGGKGLNQSIAAARAGAEVIHGGAIGPDGGFLASLLEEAGADAGHLLRLDIPTGKGEGLNTTRKPRPCARRMMLSVRLVSF